MIEGGASWRWNQPRRHLQPAAPDDLVAIDGHEFIELETPPTVPIVCPRCATKCSRPRIATRGGGVLAACGSRSIGPPGEREEDAGVIERLCKDTGGIAYFPPTGRPPGDRADESTHADADHVFSVFLHRPGDPLLHRPHPRNKRPAITAAAHACRQLMTTTASASCGSTACPHHGFGCTADAWSASRSCVAAT